MKVKVVAMNQRKGWAKFVYLDEPDHTFTTRWNPHEGRQSFRPGDIIELEVAEPN